jgi:hypothetical protein
MTQQQKDKWVAALRSGQFAQGKRRLIDLSQDPPRYCCLGVAREVLNLQTDSAFCIGEYGAVGNFDTFTFLSQDAQGRLMDLNDVQERSFLEIADYIEAYVEPNE